MGQAASIPNRAPSNVTTLQSEEQNIILGRILAEIGELRAELREGQRLQSLRFRDAITSDAPHLCYPARSLLDNGPGTLLDNVQMNCVRVLRLHFPATCDENGCRNTAETEHGVPRSMILRETLSTSMIYVGGALSPRRDMAGWSSLESCGWVNRFVIHVPTLNPAGQHLRQINIGEAFEPHRIHISWDETETNGGGWTQRLSFFVWDKAGPGRVMVSAAYARDPYRWRLELGRHVGIRPEDAGWVETISFWVPDW